MNYDCEYYQNTICRCCGGTLQALEQKYFTNSCCGRLTLTIIKLITISKINILSVSIIRCCNPGVKMVINRFLNLVLGS